MVLAALLWVLRTLEPSGTPRATSVCRAARVTACFVQVSGEKKKTPWITEPFEMLFFFFFFCDRSTDQYGKPRGTDPCSCALGETGVFEAGICLLCRKKNKKKKQKPVKVSDLSRASIAPHALRCLLVL